MKHRRHFRHLRQPHQPGSAAAHRHHRDPEPRRAPLRGPAGGPAGGAGKPGQHRRGSGGGHPGPGRPALRHQCRVGPGGPGRAPGLLRDQPRRPGVECSPPSRTGGPPIRPSAPSPRVLAAWRRPGGQFQARVPSPPSWTSCWIPSPREPLLASLGGSSSSGSTLSLFG